MAGNMETLKNLKENNKQKLNMSEYGIVGDFLGFYYEWGYYAKITYMKMTMNKYVKNLIRGYDKYTGSDLKVQKTPGDLCTAISKRELQETDHINKYRSLVGQLMWFTTKVGPYVANTARELEVQIIDLGTEHWKKLGSLIGYLKVK